MTRWAAAGYLAALTALGSAPLPAQDVERQIRSNQERLEEIRRERNQLQSELTRLRGRARSLATELANLERQRSATGRLINELDRQIGTLGSTLDSVTMDLAMTQDAHAEKQAVLRRRLVDVYKRGPLWTFQALLAAESFGDLVSRYKYLYLVTSQDQTLARSVEELRDRIAEQRRQLLALRGELGNRREERGRELGRYQELEQQRQRSLQQTRGSEREAAARLETLTRDEQRLNDLIASLERARRAAPASVGPATITADHLGRLEWPVEGDLVYRFGPHQLPNRTVVRYLGIGIKAAVGTPVHAVAGGTVDFAGTLGTYGATVVINHGGTFSTLYLYLAQINVSARQAVAAGDVVGLSGGAASDEGPHIEFQIRERTITLDPLNWLKPRR
ncbi:MAG TPA: peptidoglycan DD-metalloendopeptidase family protein [Gemmatimonadales bacterium]|nr:peptidoglycan DD-metalloendopeptidase family protein [Gemmatimonadales bacterium]